MQKTLIIKYYQDPGHGWFAVKRALLQSLNIADKITSFSYQNGDTVYCEEDCDATTLLNALDTNNIKYEIIPIHQKYTPIRHYSSYKMLLTVPLT